MMSRKRVRADESDEDKEGFYFKRLRQDSGYQSEGSPRSSTNGEIEFPEQQSPVDSLCHSNNMDCHSNRSDVSGLAYMQEPPTRKENFYTIASLEQDGYTHAQKVNHTESFKLFSSSSGDFEDIFCPWSMDDASLSLPTFVKEPPEYHHLNSAGSTNQYKSSPQEILPHIVRKGYQRIQEFSPLVSKSLASSTESIDEIFCASASADAFFSLSDRLEFSETESSDSLESSETEDQFISAGPTNKDESPTEIVCSWDNKDNVDTTDMEGPLTLDEFLPGLLHDKNTLECTGKDFAVATNSSLPSNLICNGLHTEQNTAKHNANVFHEKPMEEMPGLTLNDPRKLFGYSIDSRGKEGCNSLTTERTKNVKPLPAGSTNLNGHKIMDACLLNAENIETELSSFLQGTNLHQRFKVTYNESMRKTMTFKDLVYEEIAELVSQHRSIEMQKLPLNIEKIEKFALIPKEKKTSVLLCQTIVHGLALSAKWEEIKQTPGMDKKKLHNRFSNYQRSDRKAGLKLTAEFVEKYELNEFSSCSDIERQCCLTLAIFDSCGDMRYLTPMYRKNIVCFYEENEKLFLIKNLCGFCRIA